MAKLRLDVAMTERGLAESRQKAQAIIMAGQVFVNGQKVDKAGAPVAPDAAIEIHGKTLKYVSRGGLKLEKALALYGFSLKDSVAVDIGASTGGFTDCMLKNGARKVFAIDVGYGQLDWKLRNDPRVVNMEKVNVRYLDPETIETPVDFISIDVSFISLKLVFPVAADLLGEDGSLVCLVKPQFEAGREQVGKKGIVRDPNVHCQVIENVITYGRENGLYSHGLTWSPVTGAKGNIEYLLYMKKQPPQEEISEDAIKALVADSHAELES